MFVPIGTDAPLYHFPIGTICLIVANVVCFAATGFAFDHDRLQPWMLEYGNGLNPLEWLTSSFAHGSFGHLIGNMLFLWTFGLIVEGKLGWKRFLPLYMAMALCSNCLQDLITLYRTDHYVLKHEFQCDSIDELAEEFREASMTEDGVATQTIEECRDDAQRLVAAAKGASLGASDVIFALIGISLIWAPKNDVNYVGFIGFAYFYRAFSFGIQVMWVALWYLAMNVLGFLVAPGVGTSALHLIGCMVGLPVGIIWLKKGWVDCENWDLFAVMSGKYGQFAHKDWTIGAHGNPDYYLKDIPVPEPVAEDGESAGSSKAAKRKRQLLKDVNEFIDGGDFLSAAETLMTLRMDHSDLCPNAARTKKLALGLLQAEAWDEAEIWLQEFIDRFPEENAWARIRMAQLFVTRLERPHAALEQLKNLPTEGLSEQLMALAKKVAKTAKEQIRDGAVDREPEW